jgi:hypothetical protein
MQTSVLDEFRRLVRLFPLGFLGLPSKTTTVCRVEAINGRVVVLVDTEAA